MTKFAGKYSIAITVAMRIVLESRAVLSAKETIIFFFNVSAWPIRARLSPLSYKSSWSRNLRISLFYSMTSKSQYCAFNRAVRNNL